MRDTRIDDMKPGRELDAFVAEVVFGLEVAKQERYSQFHYELAKKAKIPKAQMDIPKYISYSVGSKVLTEYSTSWEGMRLVVEEMQRRGWWLYVDQRSDKEYNVRFWHSSKGIWSEFVLAGPLPYATILAAIKALQGEDTQP